MLLILKLQVTSKHYSNAGQVLHWYTGFPFQLLLQVQKLFLDESLRLILVITV